MMMCEYYEIFDEIFWTVADELGITAWWELFDSDNFDEVEKRITKAFDEENAINVPFFSDWFNKKAEDL